MFLYSSVGGSPYCGRLSTNVKGTAPTTTSYSRTPSAHLYMNMGDAGDLGSRDDLVQQDAERPPVYVGEVGRRSGVTGRLVQEDAESAHQSTPLPWPFIMMSSGARYSGVPEGKGAEVVVAVVAAVVVAVPSSTTRADRLLFKAAVLGYGRTEASFLEATATAAGPHTAAAAALALRGGLAAAAALALRGVSRG